MTTTIPAARGLYFEEFEVGQKMVSPGRTITESDVVGFSGVTGDFNQIHTDAEYAANSPFGARVAHGLLGLSIASGLALRTGVLEGTIMLFREITSWKFVKPMYFGDTIHVEMEIITTKALKRMGGGKVELQFDVKNQKDDTVMKGVWSVLVMAKPE
ncbi:MAG: dehydratase [Anaerolineae bacterium]|jgi:3-hydroxybutyryl-CoA dehydratase|nr:dehydratase [Anaerolineae bacterium]MBT7189245.1 dehydratase [Anaerolineae bacterium]MBT7326131.1 dehydratase [Anaerolineae bacterium]